MDAAMETVAQARSSLNHLLSQYEPLTLVVAPFLASLIIFIIAPSLSALLGELQHQGLKATFSSFVMMLLQKIPGVNAQIQKQKEEVVNKMKSGGKSGRGSWLSELPQKGLGIEVLDRLKYEKSKDASWQGRSSGAV